MRVIYYTRPDTLDAALGYTRALAQRAEVHLLMELAPGGSSPIATPLTGQVPSGIIPADEYLRALPAGVRRYWESTASFHLVSYPHRHRVHPSGLPITRRLIRLIRRLRPDAIHFDNAFLRTALLYPGLPRIDAMTVHDPAPHSGEGRWQTEAARRVLFRKVERFVVHSTRMAGVLAARYRIDPDRIDVVHLGPYDIFREWSPVAPATPDGRTILFLGRLSRYKGLDVLEEAAPVVADAVPGVRFVVAGQPAFGYQPPLSRDLPRGGRFLVEPGRVSNERLARLYGEASVVVCPYLDATQSGVVMTAYAFRTPVVATSVGGLPEYVQDETTGLIVAPNDAHALARALVRTLQDVDLRHRLTTNIDQLVETQFGWDRATDRMLASYVRARRAPGGHSA